MSQPTNSSPDRSPAASGQRPGQAGDAGSAPGCGDGQPPRARWRRPLGQRRDADREVARLRAVGPPVAGPAAAAAGDRHRRDRPGRRQRRACPCSGPKILGHATDLIFDGVIGRRLPAGIDKAQAVASLRAQGQGRVADLVNGTSVVPGQGIDFHALGVVLVGVLFLYVGASVLSLVQGYLLNGAVQRTIFALRADVEDKLNRLPLRYFDQQPRGEVLSRVTNDIDNIAQSLQQSLSQLLDLAADRHRRGHDDVRHLAAAGADRAGHGAAVDARDGDDRQAVAEAVHGAVAAHRGPQRPDRGDLHRPRAGQGVRPPARGRGGLPDQQRGALRRQLPGPVHLRDHHADDDVHREPQLRRHRRRRRAARGLGFDVPRRRPGLHPVLPAVHPAADPGRLDGQRAAVRSGLRRTGFRAAGRAGADRRPGAPGDLWTRCTGGWCSTRCRSATRPTGR